MSKHKTKVVYKTPPKLKQEIKDFAKALDSFISTSKENTFEKIGKSIIYPIQPPELLPGVVPQGVTTQVMACDSTPQATQFFSPFNNCYWTGFPGYPYLSELALRPEYRAMADANAMELTREWITINSVGVESTPKIKERIALIEQKMTELDIRSMIKLCGEHVDFFGRAQIFIDIEGADKSKPLILSPQSIQLKSLKNIKAIEPIWTTPTMYDALYPQNKDFYRPIGWYMLGQNTHASRLVTIITRPVPDMFKPMFNFSGISLSQLAEPYINNWIRTRQAINDLINNFSILVLQTPMSQLLQEGGFGGANAGNAGTLLKRVELFVRTRNNQGIFLLDKDIEDLTQLAVPLSGLSELQSQAQEHMCTVSGIPAVKLLGISPSGFNASPDGEIRTFYDKKRAEQQAYWRHPIDIIMKVIMLSEFGEIDKSINFMFNPLWQMDKKQEAEIRYFNSQTAANYMDRGVFSPGEIREILARDAESGFNGVDISDLTDTEYNPKAENLGTTEQEEQPKAEYGEGTNEVGHGANNT